MITTIRPILLAEDNANDVELTLAALRGHIANQIVVVHQQKFAHAFNSIRNVVPLPGSLCTEIVPL